ncbi:succinyl-diaminopimelate desuccinylase [Pseudoalteromonas citrea]|uniref:Succinyl-diaminopimelate desuccinylase n=1 Tax=Pseudoalteromonas citrea TaxID=43655 RepID=A0A5S3XM18_9GAMM|nr:MULTISPECIES: succinyl-diaminopimelate desuccinylase [Pseudoalteromonas]RJE78359.1 succinyl-diaminopimelate desuccinylase [Pseudoalteromonas sp. MSK9-3]TMP47380.1 succinyl-diaminopimelate desuccinylase [Pseudoalteromonas citrea]TMP55012.1 succinyl-diaminopimelate desuccinylase [Pseudoalteromonas citrea]
MTSVCDIELNNLSLKNKAIELTQHLVRFPSITPDDAGSFDYVCQYLKRLGFTCQEVTQHGVRNLIATQTFGQGKTFAFAGHLDVVPAGPIELWTSPPFAGNIISERLYGRGVADMKGGIACFIAAVEGLLSQCNKGKIMLLITCDEEGEAEHGTSCIMDKLNALGTAHLPDYCLVGEPSSKVRLGDTVKIGRRGSLSGHIRVFGQQGHVAYPHNCQNAAHGAIVLSQRLLALEWDTGSITMPGTSLQITQLNSGEFVDNIVPGTTDICFNIRYSSLHSEHSLKQLIKKALLSDDIRYEIEWQRPCAPYFNKANQFVNTLNAAIENTVGIKPILTTDGGTSDGRFIASRHTEVIEFGLRNDNIHQVNESASLADIGDLAMIYQQVLAAFCVDER